MTAKDALVLFFKAENERNWEVYQQFLHEEIVWQLFEKDTRMICGIQDYMQTIKKAYENPDAHFICQDMQVSKDGNRIVANLVNELGIRSLDIFDFKNNLIYREYVRFFLHISKKSSTFAARFNKWEQVCIQFDIL